ncbi:hypothetical protein HK105_204617 [Polyrhizophydium stewartii]|uniref:Aquaporin n=1 Tax=Polyrhizophydium stewartii TaxID=2732419 RepID=A0ABR4N8R6_9FUNG|nr:hypothetical protein HK105_004349 [Polyrhizophydium stewartii]
MSTRQSIADNAEPQTQTAVLRASMSSAIVDATAGCWSPRDSFAAHKGDAAVQVPLLVPSPRAARRQLVRKAAAEMLGTYLLVLFGIGSVACAVLTGALVGLWQSAAIWGCGATVAIYLTASISGAQLNPAVTLAMALFNHHTKFAWSNVPAYVLGQFAGAILAGATNLAMWSTFIQRYETLHGVSRSGQPNCATTSMILGANFPNPATFAPADTASNPAWLVTPAHAMLSEALGTAILMLTIFMVTDRANSAIDPKAAPAVIGATLAALIGVFAPITQGSYNPARDFGPRLVAWLAGWGECALPGPSGGFWVYLVGPIIGAVFAGLLYTFVFRVSDEELESERTM